LDSIFERFGLLGAAASRNSDQRLREMREEYKGEFRNILLALLESPDIRNRVSKILDEIADKPGVGEVVIAALVLRHIGASSDIDLLAELSGVERLNKALFARDPNIAEFLNIGHDNIVASSPIFATHALRSFWSSGRVVKLLSDMLERALILWHDVRDFGTIARDLMRFSKIDQLIPQEQHDGQLVEAIKNFDRCATNQFFWLQYAIVRITLRQYSLAEKYLETAFALASKIPGFKTYQLDNTKARLLLMRSLDEPSVHDPFRALIEAHRILMVQIGQGIHGYYPFRVASLYGEYWDKVVQTWAPDQRSVFISAVEAVRGKLAVVDRHLANHADVRRCDGVTHRILSEYRAPQSRGSRGASV
jgi:hypothetical protein